MPLIKLSISFILLISCNDGINSQVPKGIQEQIIGKWQNYKHGIYDKSYPDVEYKKHQTTAHLWEFEHNNKFIDWFSKNDSEVGSYALKDSLLKIGNWNTKIITLNDSILTIVVSDITGNIDSQSTCEYFRRVKEFDFPY